MYNRYEGCVKRILGCVCVCVCVGEGESALYMRAVQKMPVLDYAKTSI